MRGQRVFIWSTIYLFLFGITSLRGMPEEDGGGFFTAPALIYYYDAGVADRWSLQDVTGWRSRRGMTVNLGMQYHLNQHSGLGLLSFSVREIPTPFRWLFLQSELIHREYSDYRIGENLLAGVLSFRASSRFILEGGMCYRSPDLSHKRFHSLFDWNHEMNEAYFLFSLAWKFLKRERLGMKFFTGNYAYLSMNTLDHLMVGVQGEYRVKDTVGFYGEIRTALKGISGFVFSINEFRGEFGVRILL